MNLARLKYALLGMIVVLQAMAVETLPTPPGPVELLKNVTSKVMNGIKANREVMQKSNDRLYNFVDEVIMPHVDMVEMGKWVVGRNAWLAADAGTQDAFIKEFKHLVVRTYSNALLAYNSQQINFLPLRADLNKDRVQVKTIVKDDKDIRLDYNLLRNAEGEWKVYDLVIESVSLVKGYNSQFASSAKQGGLKAVVEKIKAHNAQNKTLKP